MYHDFTIFQEFTQFYLNLEVLIRFFHMYSHKDGFFPGIFPAGDLARGAHLRWRSVSMPPPIGRLWRDTQSGVQAAPWRQGGAEWDPTMGMGMRFYDCFYESQKFNIVQWW